MSGETADKTEPCDMQQDDRDAETFKPLLVSMNEPNNTDENPQNDENKYEKEILVNRYNETLVEYPLIFGNEPQINKEKYQVNKISKLFGSVLNKGSPNLTQAALISFFFNFYNAMFLLPIIDIIKLEKGEESVMFYSSTLLMISGFLSFISTSIAGALSDKIGRKPFLILSSCVLFIPLTLLLFNFHMGFLYTNVAVYILNSGSTMAMIIVSDITDFSNRDAAFGIISAMMPLSAIVGPMLSSFLYSLGDDNQINTKILTIFMLITNIFMLIYLIFIIKESLAKDTKKRTALTLENINPFRKLLKSLCDKRLFIFVIVTVLLVIPQEAIQGTYAVFLKSYLEIPNYTVSILIAQIALMTFVTLAFLMDPIIAFITHKNTILLALIVQFIGMVFASIFTKIFLVVLNGLVLSFSYISYPVLCAYISLTASHSFQGAVLGLVNSIRMLLFCFVPISVWILNKIFRIDFGKQFNSSIIVISPAYLILGITSLIAIPFVLQIKDSDEMTEN